MVLKLERLGLDISPKYNAEIYGLTDLDNHRLRAVINTKDGKEVTVDFIHGKVYNFAGGKKVLSVGAQASYYDEEQNCWGYSGLDFLGRVYMSFTKADILKAVNTVSAVQYDSIEVVDYVKL